MLSRFFGRSGHRGEMQALCEQLRASASDFIDGECDEETLALIKSHLEECNDCDGWMASLKSTVNLLRGIPPRQPSEELLERIRHATSHPNP